MMEYVEGFVAAVPSKNKQAYIAHAKDAAEMFKAHGAIQVVECWGDDVPTGEKTSFLQAVKCLEHETVVFSWVVWPNKAVRETGMKAIMQDIRMQNTPMPFDASRIIFGGFEKVLDL